MSTPSPKFLHPFKLSLSEATPEDRAAALRWLNLQHWPELGGAVPPIEVELTQEQHDAGHRIHSTVVGGSLEVMTDARGHLQPTGVQWGGQMYDLVPRPERG